jgi:hypothetical protein
MISRGFFISSLSSRNMDTRCQDFLLEVQNYTPIEGHARCFPSTLRKIRGIFRLCLVTYCHMLRDYRRGWIDNCVYWITVYTLYNLLQYTSLSSLGRVSSWLGPGSTADPTINYQLTLQSKSKLLYDRRPVGQ